MDLNQTTSLAKVGIVTGGDIVAAYLLPEGKPTEAMDIHYTTFVAANLDAGTLVVTTDRWERIRDALSEQDDVTVQDFTV